MSPTLSLTSLTPSPSRLLLVDLILVFRNVVLHPLHFILQLSDLPLKLRLEAVGGAFAGFDSLLFDNEETAGSLGRAMVVVVVAFGVGPSLPGTGLVAEELEDGGLRLAAAFEGEGVIVTHG